jgi:hypothetical protein
MVGRPIGAVGRSPRTGWTTVAKAVGSLDLRPALRQRTARQARVGVARSQVAVGRSPRLLPDPGAAHQQKGRGQDRTRRS